MVLMTWSMVYPLDESLQIVSENFRYFLQNSFDGASIHLSDSVSQTFSKSSFCIFQ